MGSSLNVLSDREHPCGRAANALLSGTRLADAIHCCAPYALEAGNIVDRNLSKAYDCLIR